MLTKLSLFFTLLPGLILSTEVLVPVSMSAPENFPQSAQKAQMLLAAKTRSAAAIKRLNLSEEKMKAIEERGKELAKKQRGSRLAKQLSHSQRDQVPRIVSKGLNQVFFGKSELTLPGNQQRITPEAYITLAGGETKRISMIPTIAIEEPVHQLFDSRSTAKRSATAKYKDFAQAEDRFYKTSHNRSNEQEVFDRFDAFQATVKRIENGEISYTTTTQTAPQKLSMGRLTELLNAGTDFTLFALAPTAGEPAISAPTTAIIAKPDEQGPTTWIKKDSQKPFDFIEDPVFIKKPQLSTVTTFFDEASALHPELKTQWNLAKIGAPFMKPFLNFGKNIVSGTIKASGIKLDSKSFTSMMEAMIKTINDSEAKDAQRMNVAPQTIQKKLAAAFEKAGLSRELISFMENIENQLPPEERYTIAPSGYFAIHNPFHKYAFLASQQFVKKSFTSFLWNKEPYSIIQTIEGIRPGQTKEQYHATQELAWYEIETSSATEKYLAIPHTPAADASGSAYLIKDGKMAAAYFCRIDDTKPVLPDAPEEIVCVLRVHKIKPDDINDQSYKPVSVHDALAQLLKTYPNDEAELENWLATHTIAGAARTSFIATQNDLMRTYLRNELLNASKEALRKEDDKKASFSTYRLPLYEGEERFQDVFSNGAARKTYIQFLSTALNHTLAQKLTLPRRDLESEQGFKQRMQKHIDANALLFESIAERTAESISLASFINSIKQSATHTIDTGLSTLPTKLISWFNEHKNTINLPQEKLFYAVFARSNDLQATYVLGDNNIISPYKDTSTHSIVPLDRDIFLDQSKECFIVEPIESLKTLITLNPYERLCLVNSMLLELIPIIDDTTKGLRAAARASSGDNLDPFAQWITAAIKHPWATLVADLLRKPLADPKTNAMKKGIVEAALPLPEYLTKKRLVDEYQRILADPETATSLLNQLTHTFSLTKIGITPLRPLLIEFYTNAIAQTSIEKAPPAAPTLQPLSDAESSGIKQLLLEKQPDGSYKALSITEKTKKITALYQSQITTIKAEKVIELQNQKAKLVGSTSPTAIQEIKFIDAILGQLNNVHGTNSIHQFIVDMQAAYTYPAITLRTIETAYSDFSDMLNQAKFAVNRPEQTTAAEEVFASLIAQGKKLLGLLDGVDFVHTEHLKNTIVTTVASLERDKSLESITATETAIATDKTTIMQLKYSATALSKLGKETEKQLLSATQAATAALFVTAPTALQELKPLRGDNKLRIVPSYDLNLRKLGIHAARVLGAGKIAQIFVKERAEFITEAILENAEALSGMLSVVKKASPAKNKNIEAFLQKKCTYVPFKLSLHGSLKHVLIWFLFYELLLYLESHINTPNA
ncbi:MAG: hypothetical protein QG632_423, partial [Candidatus Dependentiae bacterium]|nr:hypothetical protein [Candidatus Dependentiae bacterium]